MKIFILGSCVTRDAFHSRVNEGFDLRGYQARYSLARIPFFELNPPVELIEKNLSSSFQQNMLKNELSNNICKTLKKTDFDYLIVDYIDERFGLISYLQTYVTNSTEFKRAKLIEYKSKKTITYLDDEFYQFWEDGLVELIKNVGSKKIVINNVFWANKNNVGELFEGEIEYNNILRRLYSITEKYINKSQFVNYPSDILISDINHKWGVAPYHYTSEVYNYLKSYLKNNI